jgi:tetratricopeptide (TPR) repeat protein
MLKNQGVIQRKWMLLFALAFLGLAMVYGCFALQPETPSWHYLSSVLYQGQRLRWTFSTQSPLSVCVTVSLHPTGEATKKVSVGWDNEARGTELGRLPLVNNRNEYHSNEISTPNGAFSVASDIDSRVKPLVVDALQQWLAVLPAAQKTTLDVVGSETSACQHAQIQVAFLPTLDAHYTAGKTTDTKNKRGFTAALTTPVFSPTSGKLLAMNMQVALNTPAGVPQSTPLLKSILLHEMGHALGLLGHSPNPNDVMAAAYYNRAGSQAKLHLSLADKATLQALYTQPAQWSNTAVSEGGRVNGNHLQAIISSWESSLPALRTDAKTVGLALPWRKLGTALLWLGQQKEGLSEVKRTAYLQEAVQAFGQALAMNPSLSVASIELAQTYQLLKQLDAAQRVLSTAVKLNPTCTNCYLEQAWVSAKLTQWTNVTLALYNARQADPRVVQQPAYQKIEQLLRLQASLGNH